MSDSNPRKIAVNFVLLSGSEALSKVFAFVAFAYLARLMGPDTYGAIEFALAVTMFFSLVVEGGLGLLGAREIAKDEGEVKRLTFHVVVIRLFLAALAFLMLLLFSYAAGTSPRERGLLLLYGLTLFGTPGLLQWVFQGLDRMHWVAVSSMLRWSVFAGLIITYVFDPALVWMVPLFELAAVGIVVVFNYGVFRFSFGKLRQGLDVPLCISLIRQAFPIGLTQVMWGLKVYLPTIMLGLLVGGESVGWFGAAHRIVIALHTFIWMYFFNLYPSIARCTQRPRSAIEGLLGKSIQVTSWSAVFIGILGTLLAGPLMGVVYGPQYSNSAECFKILIWVAAFSLISSHYMYTLIAYNKQWLELLSAACGATVNIVLNIVLITNFGFLGAAMALLGTEAVVWTMNYGFVRRNVAHVPFLGHMIRPVVAGAFITALLTVLQPANFVVTGISATLLYGLGLAVLQPAIISDFRFLISWNR